MSKNKKILLISIILIIVIVIMVFGGIIGYRQYVLNKINNINRKEYLGDNYRVTTLLNDEILWTTYYKDGVEIMMNPDGSFEWDNGSEAYVVNVDKGSYIKTLPIGESYINTKGENGRGFGFLYNTIPNSAIGTSIETGEIDGKDYYILKHTPKLGEPRTIWIDMETLLIRKYESVAYANYNTELDEHALQPNTIEFIIETNVVTDKDVEKPNLEEYILNNP